MRTWTRPGLARAFLLAVSVAAGRTASASDTSSFERVVPTSMPGSPAAASAPQSPGPASFPRKAPTGLWIWTRRDAEVLARARLSLASVRSAVHVATVEARGDTLGWQRALSPAAVGDAGDGAILVRIADSTRALWGEGTPEEMAARLAPLLREILAQCEATGARPTEVQLDYDAPARIAPSWVRAAGVLARGPLQGRAVWITSVPSNLDAPGYAEALSETGVGHVLQLFDTGLPCVASSAAHLAARLAAIRTAFRLGLGAFERAGARNGEHACWALRSSRLASIAGYQGTWIFPAGRDVTALLGALSDHRPSAGSFDPP